MTTFTVRDARGSRVARFDANPPRGLEIVFKPAAGQELGDASYALTAQPLRTATDVANAITNLIRELEELRAPAVAMLEKQGSRR